MVQPAPKNVLWGQCCVLCGSMKLLTLRKALHPKPVDASGSVSWCQATSVTYTSSTWCCCLRYEGPYCRIVGRVPANHLRGRSDGAAGTRVLALILPTRHRVQVAAHVAPLREQQQVMAGFCPHLATPAYFKISSTDTMSTITRSTVRYMTGLAICVCCSDRIGQYHRAVSICCFNLLTVLYTARHLHSRSVAAAVADVYLKRRTAANKTQHDEITGSRP